MGAPHLRLGWEACSGGIRLRGVSVLGLFLKVGISWLVIEMQFGVKLTS